MANPIIPGIPQDEQEQLYAKLNEYNTGRASYKEEGAYLVVLPRSGYPRYSLWVYSPLLKRQSIFFIQDLSGDINQSLRVASTLCYYSARPLLVMDYNAKRMQSKGDDIISMGKYHGHFLHEIFRIDPNYISWIAYKFTPRIAKQERFVQIAQLYHSVHLDIQKRIAHQKHSASRPLGKKGDRVENLTLKVTKVKTEDDPYRTTIKGGTPHFYVVQVLTLTDTLGNFIMLRISSRVASRESCQLPSAEHAFQVGEMVYVASARIASTYSVGNRMFTRLNYVKLRGG